MINSNPTHHRSVPRFGHDIWVWPARRSYRSPSPNIVKQWHWPVTPKPTIGHISVHPRWPVFQLAHLTWIFGTLWEGGLWKVCGARRKGASQRMCGSEYGYMYIWSCFKRAGWSFCSKLYSRCYILTVSVDKSGVIKKKCSKTLTLLRWGLHLEQFCYVCIPPRLSTYNRTAASCS